jgi:hypothetical protein
VLGDSSPAGHSIQRCPCVRSSPSVSRSPR